MDVSRDTATQLYEACQRAFVSNPLAVASNGAGDGFSLWLAGSEVQGVHRFLHLVAHRGADDDWGYQLYLRHRRLWPLPLEVRRDGLELQGESLAPSEHWQQAQRELAERLPRIIAGMTRQVAHLRMGSCFGYVRSGETLALIMPHEVEGEDALAGWSSCPGWSLYVREDVGPDWLPAIFDLRGRSGRHTSAVAHPWLGADFWREVQDGRIHLLDRAIALAPAGAVTWLPDLAVRLSRPVSGVGEAGLFLGAPVPQRVRLEDLPWNTEGQDMQPVLERFVAQNRLVEQCFGD